LSAELPPCRPAGELISLLHIHSGIGSLLPPERGEKGKEKGREERAQKEGRATMGMDGK